ncbi:hypothetical protein GCM10009113_12100 [Marinobacter szutsaonensis]
MLGQYLGAVTGMLVAAVMADFFAEQASADSDGDAAHVLSPVVKTSLVIRDFSLARSAFSRNFLNLGVRSD